MSLSIRDFIAKAPWRALASLGVFVAAGVVAGGCVVRVHDEPVVRERVVHREVIAPEQAETEVVVEEPVATVVFEPAPVEVVTQYETDLGPHGHWQVIGSYGKCWVWNGMRAGWRPYSVGHWVASDNGWLWVAEGDEAEWGATCYHYGRWHEEAGIGWVWVPGQVWAPSWCAWREGSGYSCWAPLPPECGDGHVLSAEVVDHYCPADRFVCVETRNIGMTVNIHDTIIVENRLTIINKTTNITKITYVNNRAVNRGIDVKIVEKAAGHPIKVEKSVKVTTAAEAHRQIALGHAVEYTPPVIKSAHAAHPIAEIHKKVVAEHKLVEHKTAIEHKEIEKKPEVEHKTAIEHKEIEKKPEVEHKTAIEHKEVEHKEIEKKPEVEHKTAIEHKEVEHKEIEKKPEVEHKTVEHKEIEKKPEVEHRTVEHKEIEKKPEVEHKTVEHKEIEKKPEVEHKTVEHKEIEKKPEVEHKTVEHKEVEKKPEVEHKPAVDPKKDPKKDPRKPEEPPK